MKREILKKTLLYRLLAYVIALVIGFFSPMPITASIVFVSISEVVSLVAYYIYEYLWRRHMKRTNLKKGMSVLLIKGNDKHDWYEVIEVLEENKLVIKVV